MRIRQVRDGELTKSTLIRLSMGETLTLILPYPVQIPLSAFHLFSSGGDKSFRILVMFQNIVLLSKDVYFRCSWVFSCCLANVLACA